MEYQKMPETVFELYNQIKKEKVKYGEYLKGTFHIHTPASYDYAVSERFDNIKQITDEDIFSLCCELEEAFAKAHSCMDDVSVPENFDSKREYLSFMALALKIIKEKLNYVIVSDHNTKEGCLKLETAIRIASTGRKLNPYPQVIYGVEISCADKNHVVVIYNHKSADAADMITTWLEDEIMSLQDGCYHTSQEVLSTFQGEEFISYIAHINTSNTFNSEFFSNAYRKALLLEGEICNIGVNSPEVMEDTLRRVQGVVSERECHLFLDNDSHNIEKVAEKQTYIKGTTGSFKTLYSALLDYDSCVSFSQPIQPQTCIEGLIVVPGEDGFLCKSAEQNQEPFVMNFSPAMNCLIGGRGTGKSTVINLIDMLLGGNPSSVKTVEHICNHNEVFLLLRYNAKEYLVDLSQPVKEYSTVANTLLYADGLYYKRKAMTEEEKEEHIFRIIHQKFVDVYRLACVKDEMRWIKLRVNEKNKLLKNVFNAAYSIHEIMNMIYDHRISEFLLKQIKKNEQIDKALNISIPKRIAAREIVKIQSKLTERDRLIDQVLLQFNIKQNKRLKLVRKSFVEGYEYASILFNHRINRELFCGYNITRESILMYLSAVIDKMGVIETIDAFYKKDYRRIMPNENLLSYCEEMTYDLVNKNVRRLEHNEQHTLLEALRKEILQDGSERIVHCLKRYVSSGVHFDLEFNVFSSDASENRRENYKSIADLSLGQKVVAILSFILSYGKFTDDNTPLIVDQPEDNLDSHFIYENLVAELKKIKDQRQVIIATHNSTLVTNTKAEQVIVLQSNNQNGWIEAAGYPTSPSIVKKIILYLEGGKKSFVHRFHVYRSHIGKIN